MRRGLLVILACALVAACSTTEHARPRQADSVPAMQGRHFPDAASTGVPHGVALETYDGSCTISASTTLRRVDATRVCEALVVESGDLVVEESRIPRVEATAAVSGTGAPTVRLTDSEVRAGTWSGGAVWGSRITVLRVEVTGGQHSIHCIDRCVVEESWLHDQYSPEGEEFHNNAFLSNGGQHMVVRGNTLHCTPELNDTNGGCTGDLSLFGDFAPIRDVRVTDNLFRANGSSVSYCLHAGHAPSKPFPVARGVVITGNVFERGADGTCGVYGAVTSFQASAERNEWRDNIWDDGTPVRP